MSQRAAVFSSYRRLYRARAALFRGDTKAMKESRVAVREQYLQHGAQPIPDLQHFEGLLGMVDEAEDMMRHGIVRGDLNQKTGHYGMCVLSFVGEAHDGIAHDITLVLCNMLRELLIVCFSLPYDAEVKLKKEHVETGSNQPPLVEPITPKVVEQMEQKPPSLADVKVNTTNSSKN